MKRILYCVLLLFGGWVAGQPPVLITNAPLPGIAAASMGWADVDLDGRLDLLMAGVDSLKVPRTVLLRNLPGGFSPVTSNLPGLVHAHCAWADYDGDGDPDLLLAGNQGKRGYVGLWRNTGGFGLVPTGISFPQLLIPWVRWADLDLDGDEDLLLGGWDVDQGFMNLVYENTGGQLVGRGNAGLGGNALVQASAGTGDLVGDSLPDIVISGIDSEGQARVMVWEQSGRFQFVSVGHNLPSLYGGSVDVVDVDGDGDGDLAGCGNGPRIVTGLWPSEQGFLSPVAQSGNLPALGGGMMAWGDLNLDGRADVVCAGEGANGTFIRVMRALAGANFVDMQAAGTLPALHQPVIRLGDWNGDGRLDAALSGYAADWQPFSLLLRWDVSLNMFVP